MGERRGWADCMEKLTRPGYGLKIYNWADQIDTMFNIV